MTSQRMDGPEGVWLEAAAGIQAEIDEELRADAREVFVAEAARTRLSDRGGRVRIATRSGGVLVGRLMAPLGPEGTLSLLQSDGRVLNVACPAIVLVTGVASGLRDESGPSTMTLGAYLRECWAVDDDLRVLASDGRWFTGTVVFVGADHCDLDCAGEVVTVPFTAMEAWQIAPVG
jgi:hypothetical protein